MIQNVIGVPQLTLLDAVVFANSLGLTLGSFRPLPPFFVKHRPLDSVKKPGKSRKLIYISSVAQYNTYASEIHAKKQVFLVFLSAPSSALMEHGLQVYHSGTQEFTADDFAKVLHLEPTTAEVKTVLGPEKERDLSIEILTKNNRDSLLQKLQSNIYRIRDAVEREIIQKKVYAYLGGEVKTLPRISYPFVANLITSDLAVRLRNAVKEARSSHNIDKAAENANLDRFEVAYILSKVGIKFD